MQVELTTAAHPLGDANRIANQIEMLDLDHHCVDSDHLDASPSQ
jgi:hypothetical protein